MISSIQSISCYRYCEETQTNAIFKGPGSQVTKQTIAEDETGLVDLEGKNAKQSIQSIKLDHDGNTLDSQEIETYLIEDKLYTRLNGKWTRSMVSGPVKSIAFDERNKLRDLAELISGSNIEVIGTEIIDGQKCYKLKVEPKMDTARSILADRAFSVQSSAPISLPDASIEDLSESDPLLYNSDISYTVWLTEDEYIPMKVDAEMEFEITPVTMKAGPGKASDFRVDAATEDILTLSDFNTSGDIDVPDEANEQMNGDR
jgi:hypothetical protein